LTQNVCSTASPNKTVAKISTGSAVIVNTVAGVAESTTPEIGWRPDPPY
jgi:hypothetical protein